MGEIKIGTCPTCRAPTKGDLYRNEELLARDVDVVRLRARITELEADKARLVAALEQIASSLNEAMPNEYESLAVDMRNFARAELDAIKGGSDER